MLPELHTVLKDLIYTDGQVKATEVDVTFDLPNKEWADKLVRPTINLYLFELQENTELRQAQFQQAMANGMSHLRAAPRRIDLRYVVTAMTTDSDDAFRLLWRVLGVLMRAPELEARLFPDDLKLDAPIVTRVAQQDSGIKLLDVWSALSAEPRAAFCYVVTLPLDLEIEMSAPLVLGSTVRYRSTVEGEGGPETRTQIHGVVHNVSGEPVDKVTVATVDQPYNAGVTDAQGMFSLRKPNSGKVALRLSHDDGRSTTTEINLDAKQSAYELVLRERPRR